jgi:uncharacterized membrane protein
MTALLLAFAIGISSGLRTMTAPAAVLLARGGSVWGIAGIVVGLGALAEYVVDLLPSTPARTRPAGLVVRVISGAFVGWAIAGQHGGNGTAGAVAGVIGALIGAYGGHAARVAAIASIGGVPAALVEDAVAIALAVFVVTR